MSFIPAIANTSMKPHNVLTTTTTDASKSSFQEVLSRTQINNDPISTRSLSDVSGWLEQIEFGRKKLEHVIAQARSGKSFSPRELLSIQADLYQAIEQSSMAQRIAEEGVSGLKRLWNIQL